MNKCLSCGKSVKNKYCNVSCQNRHQQKGKIKSKKSIEKQIQTVKNKWKTFIVNCFECRKEIEIKEFNTDEPKKEKYYCSRSCANTRHHNNETKRKISKSIIQLIINGNPPGYIKNAIEKCKEYKYKPKEYIIHKKICLFCNKEFITTKRTQHFCSRLCARRYNIQLASNAQQEKIKNNPDWWSQIHKKAYANGHNYVAGGTTKWYDYKNIRVQGTYELRTCFILDRWKEEGKIKNWEYTNDRIQYIGKDNEKHNYLYMCAKDDFSGYHNFAVSPHQHAINARKYHQALRRNKIQR